MSVIWDPSVTTTPGIVVQQPDREPQTLTPPKPDGHREDEKECTEPAEKLLDCLGLKDPDVKKVRVKSVCLEIDLKDEGCGDC